MFFFFSAHWNFLDNLQLIANFVGSGHALKNLRNVMKQ